MRRTWRVVAVAFVVGACGGSDDPATLEEWLSAEVPDVTDEDVDCVAAELRADVDPATLDEWRTLEVSRWSEEDYLEHPEVSEALAEASFSCLS